MTGLLIIVCAIMVGGNIIRASCEAKLLGKDPAAWTRLKEAREKRKKQWRQAMGFAALGIARILLKGEQQQEQQNDKSLDPMND